MWESKSQVAGRLADAPSNSNTIIIIKDATY